MEEKTDTTKEMPIADLTRIIQEGFSSIERKLNGIEERLVVIEEKLSEIETETKEVKLETQDIKFHLAKKADKVEHDALKHHVGRLEKKLAQLEREV
jgi:hypothetical protein